MSSMEAYGFTTTLRFVLVSSQAEIKQLLASRITISGAMDIFHIVVQPRDNVVEVGECDVDHISLITLIHAIYQKFSGSCDVTHLNYKGDSEKDDDKDYETGREEEDTRFNEVPIIYKEGVEESVEVDEELEPDQVRIAKLVKGQPFKRMVDGVIRFNIGQIFNSKEHMREIFKDYAIQEGIEFTIVKNDKVRQTYKCATDGCGWRAHASCMIDGVTFRLKTLSDQYDCHKVYNNKEAKVKWIASMFEKLFKSNPSIDVKVIGDLSRESFKVSVDIRRLYKAKNIAHKELAKDHA
ncbi:hypothetical protein Ddye_029207 [Dipteronia dyeriana]|uniref:Transposase MuDR plant domain-containing protein n=1 Tax=Dipteronia dyeriana TaxID=168575 RepID=A0AAD9TDY3_9ROSI|nr:hypothetical protein Ddye_029207 [Dipteronia dyeriana]